MIVTDFTGDIRQQFTEATRAFDARARFLAGIQHRAPLRTTHFRNLVPYANALLEFAYGGCTLPDWYYDRRDELARGVKAQRFEDACRILHVLAGARLAWRVLPLMAFEAGEMAGAEFDRGENPGPRDFLRHAEEAAEHIAAHYEDPNLRSAPIVHRALYEARLVLAELAKLMVALVCVENLVPDGPPATLPVACESEAKETVSAECS